LVQAQNRLERFSVDNKLGCNCCSLFALDLKKVFDAFVVSYTTLSVVELYDINFFSSFPFRQLSKCKNLSALEITRCYNFGPDITLYNDMDPTSFAHLRKISIFYSGMPSKILRILLTQAGHSLRQLKLVESESTENHFPEIVQSCITHNSNVTHFLVPIHPREISLLPSFLNSCVRLEHFEIWYKNSHEFDLEEVLPDIGISLPPNLKIFNVNMNWLFTPESFG
ncbi:4864_t:CDS:1, partial [Acaulospora morrowiae]